MNFDTCSYEVIKPEKNQSTIIMSVTILFVLEHTVTVHVLDTDYTLNEGDILMVNPGVEYSYKETADAIVGIALFSMKLLNSVMNGKSVLFYCNSVDDKTRSYEDIRAIFYNLTEDYLYGRRQSDCRIDSNLYLLLDTLIEHYQTENLNEAQGNPDNDIRMQQMMQYIIGNLDQEVNLTALADSMFVSASTLSRIFKKNTGVYFADYVTKLRLQQSLLLLSGTDQNITQIALTCGFTNSTSFNRAFRKEMNMSPTKYRETHSDEVKERDIQKEKIEDEIRVRLEKNPTFNSTNKLSGDISVDILDNPGRFYEKPWDKMINGGSIDDLTHANMQYHVQYVSDKLHFKYVRVWSLFSTKLMITDGSGRNKCNFNMVDTALDFLVSNHLKVFLSLGRRPDMAAVSGGDVYKHDDYIPFVSKKAWQTALTEFFSHILERYGLNEVSGWAFELTFLPFYPFEKSRLWEHDPFSVEEAYDHLYKLVRQKTPGAEIGGFGIDISSDWERVSELYTHVVKKNEVPDFASFLLFPYDNVFDADGKYTRKVSKDRNQDILRVKEMRTLMEQTGLSDKKLYIIEFNESISNRNYVNDSCFRAAYIASRAEALLDNVDMMSVMCASDWISNYMDSMDILNGSIGLISKDRIKKPAYYALAFLNALGKTLLSHGKNHIITKADNGEVQMLLFNSSWFSAGYFLGPEEIPLQKIKSGAFFDEAPLELNVEILNMPKNKTWYVKKRILNRNHGSILDEWEKFQYESRLTRSDVKYLESISEPKMTLEKAYVDREGNLANMHIELKPHELCLVKIFSMD